VARTVKCPHCGHLLKAGPEVAGKRVQCAACHKPFLAPRALAEARPPRSPGASPEKVWHLHIGGKDVGPLSAEEVVERIRSAEARSQTLAWRQGMAEWQDLGAIAEFRAAFDVPPPVRRTPPRAAEHKEHHRRYIPGARRRRDVVFGVCIAGGLTVVLVVVALVAIYHRPEPQPPKKTTKQVILTTAGEIKPAPATPTPVERPKAPTTRRVRVVKKEISNEALLARAVADLQKRFAEAIGAHKRGDLKPIQYLAIACTRHADKLAERDWGNYAPQVNTLVERLRETASGIAEWQKEWAERWELGKNLPDKVRAETLELNNFQWLARFQSHVNDQVQRLREKGLQF